MDAVGLCIMAYGINFIRPGEAHRGFVTAVPRRELNDMHLRTQLTATGMTMHSMSNPNPA